MNTSRQTIKYEFFVVLYETTKGCHNYENTTTIHNIQSIYDETELFDRYRTKYAGGTLMFVGHFASGMGFYTTLKENRVVLFMVVLGTQFLDVLWGLFILLGIEGGISGGDVRNNLFNVPWTHSLLMAVVWSLVYGSLTWWIASVRGYDTSKFPKVAAFAVFSHWILDMLVHGKDMLLTPFSSTALPSLHLWEMPVVALIVEFSILMISWYFYYMKIKDHESVGRSWAVLIIYLILLATTYLPSINHTPGMQVTPVLGIMSMILLPVIAVLPSLFYPKTSM